MVRTPAPIIRPQVESIVVLFLFLAISLWSAAIQPGERVFGDAKQYHLMAQQFGASLIPVTANPPFVFRPATPWLAGLMEPAVTRALPAWLDRAIEDRSGLKGVAPFYLINILASLATSLALAAYLRYFVPDVGVRLSMVACWMLQWQAPVRFLYFYPVNVEPLFLLMAVLGLIVVERSRRTLSVSASVCMALLAFFGTLCRESMLLVALTFAVCHVRRGTAARGRAAALLILPLAAALAALVIARLVGAPAAAYSPWAEMLAMAREKPLPMWMLSWSFAFGLPVIAIILAAGRVTWGVLRSRPELAFYLAACGVLAYVGGTDTERILGWATPVMYALAGTAVVAFAGVLRPLASVTAGLVVMQSVSARWFWPIPVGIDDVRAFAQLDVSWASLMEVLDKAFVIDNYYSNLWSFYGSRAIHSTVLACDAALAFGLVLFLRRRERQARLEGGPLARVDRSSHVRV
jgi:hypothetical protein